MWTHPCPNLSHNKHYVSKVLQIFPTPPSAILYTKLSSAGCLLPPSSAASADPCLSPLYQSANLTRGRGCAPSGAQEEERRDAPPLRVRPRPSGPAPPWSLPAPPAVPWQQSRSCRPMNGVAFCLVGIPPRPEPRPPKVRVLSQGRGRIQALTGSWQLGPGSLRPRSAGTAWGARRGHHGHGCREHRLVAGEGAGARAALGRGREGRRQAGGRG